MLTDEAQQLIAQVAECYRCTMLHQDLVDRQLQKSHPALPAVVSLLTCQHSDIFYTHNGWQHSSCHLAHALVLPQLDTLPFYRQLTPQLRGCHGTGGTLHPVSTAAMLQGRPCGSHASSQSGSLCLS